jgi:hypothetical protein
MSLQLFATIFGGVLQMQAQQEQAAIAAGNAEQQAEQREIDLKLQKIEASQRATLRLEEFENALATNEALFATMRDIEASPYTTVGAFLGGQEKLVARDISRNSTQSQLEQGQTRISIAADRAKSKNLLAAGQLSAMITGANTLYKVGETRP